MELDDNYGDEEAAEVRRASVETDERAEWGSDWGMREGKEEKFPV